MLSVGMKESQEQVITVQDVQPSIFRAMLHFIYTDELGKFESPDQVVELMVAANKYGLERLKRLCEKQLVQVIDLDNVI